MEVVVTIVLLGVIFFLVIYAICNWRDKDGKTEKEKQNERLKKEREAELAKLNDIEYTKVVTTSTTSSGNMYGHHSVAKTTFLIVYKDGSKGVVEVPHNSEFYLEYAMRVKTR